VIVLDASPVIALFNSADAHHEAAASLLAEHAAGGFGMHPLTLAEVLVGGARVGRANQMMAELRAMGVSQLTPPDDEPLLLAELRSTTNLKLPDCCVLATALRQTASLVTFDAGLADVAASLGLRVIPS
jgi:predicted nucleic acid-binding protein